MAQYRFGDWIVDTVNGVIDHEHPSYPIPLARLLSPSGILDFLAQVNMKTWSKRETIGNLLDAMEYCIGLQANVCGGGISKNTTIEEIKKRLKHPPRQPRV